MSQEPVDDTGPYFARLSQELMADQDVQATLERICELSLRAVPAADFAGITVRQRRGRLTTLAHTDEIALTCDELQYGLGEGPCIDTALEDEPFVIHSTREDPRWPRWGPEVADRGVHSLISVQLPATIIDPDRPPLGAINIYGRRIDAFDDEALRRARTFAVHAGAALTFAHQATTLDEAIEARHQVGVAQGILMVRYGLTPDQAFEALQRYSSHANVKLRDVAATVVADGEFPASYAELVGGSGVGGEGDGATPQSQETR